MSDETVENRLGKGWEQDARQRLAEVPYDTELGIEMARDAQRVSNGELSEQEFYEKYHEQVVAEFGTDKRPPEMRENE